MAKDQPRRVPDRPVRKCPYYVWAPYVAAGLLVVSALAVIWSREAGTKPTAGAPPVLNQATIDAVIPPLPADMRATIAESEGPRAVFVDTLRQVYAALPVQVRQAVSSTGEYAFHVADLPKAQADVIKDLVLKQHLFRGTLEDNWLGKQPLDLSDPRITFLFQRQGQYVAFRCRYQHEQGRNEANFAPIGMWSGGR